MLSALKLLQKKSFVSAATSSLQGQPNAAPKLVLDVDKEFIYLVDHISGKTWQNLKANPQISLSFTDSEELKGYRINGRVKILEKDAIGEDIINKLDDRKLALSIDRVVSGVRREKKHKVFEVEMPNNFVVYKIKMEEITEIKPEGSLRREKMETKQ